jgi:hypothetical protein
LGNLAKFYYDIFEHMATRDLADLMNRGKNKGASPSKKNTLKNA